MNSPQVDKNKIILVFAAAAAILAIGIAWYFFPSAPSATSIKNTISKTAVEVAGLINVGDYAGAQNLLIEKIGMNSAPELKLLLAASYLDEGGVRGQEAEASKKAQDILFELEKSYRGTYIYDLIGYSYEIVGNYDKALGYYGRSLISDNKSVNTLFGIGHVHAEKQTRR